MKKRRRTTLTAFARQLRSNSSDAELRLWWQLRDRRLAGAKFRRQLPIGPYIADFACVQAKLVVELDGGQHSEQAGYDARRTAFLEQQGYRVLRFWNDDVLREMGGVLMIIEEALGDSLACRPPHPGPLPRFAGERE